MTQLAYTAVIATFERPDELAVTLESLRKQSRVPESVIVIDASRDERTRQVAEQSGGIPIRFEKATEPSAARQRNQGARLVKTPLVAFIDDDVNIAETTCEKLCETFERDAREEIGGVAARIDGLSHPEPRKLLWLYYRLQAGYSHPTYGGKLFGPAINCLPSYTDADGDLIPSDWLNSTCVFYRTDLFLREMFPEFQGYSFMEDVHVSARVGRTHKLFFHKTARFQHFGAGSAFKRNARALARMRRRHQRTVAREVMGQHGLVFELKFFLSRLFGTVALLRSRPPGWKEELIGAWT